MISEFTKALTLCSVGALYLQTASAETIIAVCYEPNGQRVDYLNGNFEHNDDGYANSNPTFSFSSERPDILIEFWQAANPFPDAISRAEVDAITPPNAIEATVLYRTESVIHAIHFENGESYTATLYLNHSVGIFTRVQVVQDGAAWNNPMGAVYAAKCTIKSAP